MGGGPPSLGVVLRLFRMFDDFARWPVDPSGLTPHGVCLLWEPGLIWLHAVSDVAVGLAYFTIPLALAIIVKRQQDLVFKPVLVLFAAFIVLCGDLMQGMGPVPR